MDSPSAGGRRRGNSRINAEDQALDQIAKEVSYVRVICLSSSLNDKHLPPTVVVVSFPPGDHKDNKKICPILVAVNRVTQL